MTRTNLEGADLRGVKFKQSISGGVLNITSGATITLPSDSPMIVFAILTGSGQNLVLPAITEGNTGRMFIVFNNSATALSITVKQADGTTTVITIAQNKAGILTNNGTLWYGLLGA